jgi:agmatine/peptidylarginine deiminase
MISDSRTNTIYFSDLLRTDKKYNETFNDLHKVLTACGMQYDFLNKTKDIWARDYMPIQVSKDKFVEFRFDPDYLQGTETERRELKTYPDMVCDDLGIKTVKSDIILDGGNVIKSDNAVILTEKILLENWRTYNENELIRQLEILFETDKIIIIPKDPGEMYGHSDGAVRFIDNDTVLINWYYRTFDEYFRKSLLDSITEKGLKYEWMDLGLDGDEANGYNWAYINFLQTEDLILVPKMGIKEDDIAFSQICKFYKSYADRGKIIQVDSRQVVENEGALNCISWTIMK